MFLSPSFSFPPFFLWLSDLGLVGSSAVSTPWQPDSLPHLPAPPPPGVCALAFCRGQQYRGRDRATHGGMIQVLFLCSRSPFFPNSETGEGACLGLCWRVQKITPLGPKELFKNPPSQKEGRRLSEKSEGISFPPAPEEDDSLFLPLKWTK